MTTYTAANVAIYVEQPPDRNGETYWLDRIDLDGNVIQKDIEPSDAAVEGDTVAIVQWVHRSCGRHGLAGWEVFACPEDDARDSFVFGDPSDPAPAVAEALDLLGERQP